MGAPIKEQFQSVRNGPAADDLRLISNVKEAYDSIVEAINQCDANEISDPLAHLIQQSALASASTMNLLNYSRKFKVPAELYQVERKEFTTKLKDAEDTVRETHKQLESSLEEFRAVASNIQKASSGEEVLSIWNSSTAAVALEASARKLSSDLTTAVRAKSTVALVDEQLPTADGTVKRAFSVQNRMGTGRNRNAIIANKVTGEALNEAGEEGNFC